MPRRQKLKNAEYKIPQAVIIHDRRTMDLPANAQVAEAVVDDPYSNIGEKVTVFRSVRDDPLAAMRARGQIEQHQYEAGRLWERYSEAATVGTSRAIDPTKEAVDGGKIYDGIGDHQIAAINKLAKAKAYLGHYDAALVERVLTDRNSLTMVAQQLMMFTDRERNYLGRRFCDALQVLAEFWNLAMRRHLTCQANRL